MYISNVAASTQLTATSLIYIYLRPIGHTVQNTIFVGHRQNKKIFLPNIK